MTQPTSSLESITTSLRRAGIIDFNEKIIRIDFSSYSNLVGYKKRRIIYDNGDKKEETYVGAITFDKLKKIL